MPSNTCTLCEHKRMHTGAGHCYLFQQQPPYPCAQHTGAEAERRARADALRGKPNPQPETLT